MHASPFSASFSVRGDVVVVSLAGEIDIAVADRVHDHLTAATMLAERAVVVDFDGVTFIDSTGLRAIESVSPDAFRAGVVLVLAAAGPATRRLLDAVSPPCRVPVLDSVALAVGRFSRTPGRLRLVPTIRRSPALRRA